MSMNYFEKNMMALEKKNASYAKEIRNIDIDKVSERIKVINTANGMKILSVNRNGRYWNLNSRLNPEYSAEIYWERYKSVLYGIYFVYGAADECYMQQCVKICDVTNRIVFCEPDIEVFYMACNIYDLSDIISDERVFFYFPEVSEIEIKYIVDTIISYSHTKLLEFCILPGYDVCYPEQCELYMNYILDKVSALLAIKSTYLGFNRMIPRHTLFHMKNLIKHCNPEQVKHKLTEFNIENIPAIIVSAGPSLDKNVHELKKAEGKAFIIVVDAALRTVLRAGVRPDMVYTIDPESPDRFFENLDLDGLIWGCSRIARPEVIKKYAGKLFYNGLFWGEWNREISGELGYIFPWLTVGGSVTSEAFQFAAYLGFKKFILIGQDMAFTGGVSHTEGIENAFGDNDEYIDSRLLMEVEGNDGTMLKTDFQMFMYKNWFENLFQEKKDNYEVINATEGGAKIKGTRVSTLKEAILEECIEEFSMYDILHAIPSAFDAQQQARLLHKLQQIPSKMKAFEEELETIIEKQEKLLDKIKNNSIMSKEILRQLKEMVEDNKKIDAEPIRDMVILYTQKEEWQVGEDVYKEDIGPKELVENSLLLLRGYRSGMKELEEDVWEYILKDIEK